MLEGHDTREIALDAIKTMAEQIAHEGTPEDVYFEEWDPEILVALSEEAGVPKGYVTVDALKEAVVGVHKHQEGVEPRQPARNTEKR